MLTIEKVTANGKEYKEANGTYYAAKTPEKVIQILEDARRNDTRIRVFYGDIETGRDWLEEYDTIGTIGRSAGTIKVPLLISKISSYGGGAILTDCIVRITIDKQNVYKHSNYYIGKLEIKEETNIEYKAAVYRDGENIANFKNSEKAAKYINFIEGGANRK